MSRYIFGRNADQVALALEKIISHIGNPKKFKKASPLLRQLLSQGVLTAAHSNLLFEVRAQHWQLSKIYCHCCNVEDVFRRCISQASAHVFSGHLHLDSQAESVCCRP
jgi:hypothetical protein